jgi:pSer/pThr/pTyr-binding forkhead associated (FHA) protein
MNSTNSDSPRPDSGCEEQLPPILRTATPLDRSHQVGPLLRLVSIPGAQKMEFHRRELVIGRHSSADVQLPNREVSRFHCRLFHANDCWQVEDMDSLNGTVVNGEQVEHSALRHNDVLRIGAYLFQIDLGTGEERAANREILSHPSLFTPKRAESHAKAG